MTPHTLPTTRKPPGKTITQPRIAFVGKGGSGKSTIIAHTMAHLHDKNIPCSAMDADEPGDDEPGSLLDWDEITPLAGPVYPAPSRSHLRARAHQLTPPDGLLLIDTGAWLRKAGGTHFAVLSAADLVVLTMAPTRMEISRAGSVLAAMDHLTEVGAHTPQLVILLTMLTRSASSGAETAQTLRDAGYTVLRTSITRSDAKDGYAQSFGREPRVIRGSSMDCLTDELLDLVTR
ncbi:hypothetical protein [Rhodococcus qingshengii]|uniref:hypothetical protein n=1 Tax=Rhodococcus qingshengii TaxID=334542 RepID=UPI0035E24E68